MPKRKKALTDQQRSHRRTETGVPPRKPLFDPNPELKDLPQTEEEVERMHQWDRMLHRLDDAQALLLKMQLQITTLEVKLKNHEVDVQVLLADRDAAIRILGVVLCGQSALLEEGRKVG